MPRPAPPSLEQFPLVSHDKIRYADTDRQGHVNNALFSTFLETGRVEMLYDPQAPLADDNCEFVIARSSLDYLSELRWPGTVSIGDAAVSPTDRVSRKATGGAHRRVAVCRGGEISRHRCRDRSETGSVARRKSRR